VPASHVQQRSWFDGGLTIDTGVIVVVSGDTITIEEGSDGKGYKKVDVTIPADADISRDTQAVGLGDLKTGDETMITRSDYGTEVVAFHDEHVLPFLPTPERSALRGLTRGGSLRRG
jgi:hypothetical protein